MYADDFNGNLVWNREGDTAGMISSIQVWAGGWLDFSSSANNTNTELLVSFGSPAGKWSGLLGNYVNKATTIFRCPDDLSSVTIQNKTYQRVRSVSMNTYMNGVASGDGSPNGYVDPGFRLYRKSADIFRPRPSATFVFIDEHEVSINDGVFEMDLPKCLGNNNELTPGSFSLIDFPSNRHNGGSVLSFADGHAELWTWRDSRTAPVIKFTDNLNHNVSSPNNVDVGRLALSTSARR
jgi:prepilin-type processing-associated H-X9-DG protein